MAMVPAMFMTAVCGTYFGYSQLMLRQDLQTSVIIGLIITALITILFICTQVHHDTKHKA